MYLVSADNAVGVRMLLAGFPTEQEAICFVELEIEALLNAGAEVLLIINETTLSRRVYRVPALADCILVAVDWARALVDES
jgi:hypothetical protein